ncbi:MAG: FkbM family methyltransferase, partial [Myxococcales bacterium]|nr:FkbM family methyltransferase [Myxococcales bacterium]
DYAASETRMMRYLVLPGDTVADIGANFGWYTTLFAQAVGPDGKVLAFEPATRTHAELREHVEMNDLDARVVRIKNGLGKEPGSFTLHSFPGQGHGLSSLSALGESEVETETIEVVTLDSVARERGVGRFDLLKVDVEGAEWDVFRGAGEVLSKHPLIAVEINEHTAAHFGYRPNDMLWWLGSIHGYNAFFAYRRDHFVELTSPDDARHAEMIICARKEVHGDRIAQWPRVKPSQPAPGAQPSGFSHVRRERCPVCDSTEFASSMRLFDDRYGMPDEFDVAECYACGAHFLREYVPESEMGALYGKYYGTTPPPSERGSLAQRIRHRVRGTALWDQVMGGVDLGVHAEPGERVLDVGCGFGTNAGIVESRGASWFGVDVNPEVCAYLQGNGRDAFCGTLDQFTQKRSRDKFDLVLLSQVLEHAPDPIALLRSAAKCLEEGGRIVLSCPNVESRYRRDRGADWLHWHVPYHVVQFSPEALAVAAHRSGLRVDWCKTQTPPSWFLAQRDMERPERGERNASFGTPFRPLAWLSLSPFLRAGDVLVKDGGDALVACLRKG